MAEDLIEAQSAALQAQQEILNNGEELRVTLRESTQGKNNSNIYPRLSSGSQIHQHLSFEQNPVSTLKLLQDFFFKFVLLACVNTT